MVPPNSKLGVYDIMIYYESWVEIIGSIAFRGPRRVTVLAVSRSASYLFGLKAWTNLPAVSQKKVEKNGTDFAIPNITQPWFQPLTRIDLPYLEPLTRCTIRTMTARMYHWNCAVAVRTWHPMMQLWTRIIKKVLLVGMHRVSVPVWNC